MVEEIVGLQSFNETTQNNNVVLIDVWAAWCGPCKMIAPIVDEIANENTNVKVIKVDADSNPEILAQYGIRSIPTLLYFKDNTLKDKIVGAVPKNMILEKLNKL